MCCPICGTVHIKHPLLLVGKSSLCGGSRFLLKICQNVRSDIHCRLTLYFRFTNHEGWNATYKDVYAKVLHKYGQTVGLWQQEISHYGGLIHVQFDEGRIIGRQCLPPVAPTVTNPLRIKTLFTIQFSQDQEEVEIFCHQGCSDAHKGNIQWRNDGTLVFRCSEIEHHQHPEGKEREFQEWLVEETGYPSNELFVHGQELPLMKFLITTQLGYSYPMTRITPPSRRESAVIQPGFFKGTYGAHGIEIIMLSYDDSGKSVEGIKITGDPNVPATKVSFTVDLMQPIVLNYEQQRSVHLLEQIDIPELPPDTDITQLPPQSFVVPYDCLDRFENAPGTCRARFVGKGQIAGHNYRDPSFSPGHWIVFDENMFGFLWLQLRSLSMYSRVMEDLWS